MNKEEIKTNVTKILTAFLEKEGLRKTQERHALLDYIYGSDSIFFNAEDLYLALANSKIRISLATVYNTLDIFLRAKLMKKVYLGERIAKFEKLYGVNQSDHLICSKCGKVQSLQLSQMDDLQNTISKTLHYDLKYRSLTFYTDSCLEQSLNCNNRS